MTAIAAVIATAGVGAAGHPAGVRVGCATRSEASFPGAFANANNVVVGPLVFVGAAYTSEGTVRRFGGNKFPVLVKGGHTVTVTVSPGVRPIASLGYGPLPQGRSLTARDGHETVTFVACRDDQPSGSSADGPVTFWAGFVLADPELCPARRLCGRGAVTTPRRAAARPALPGLRHAATGDVAASGAANRARRTQALWTSPRNPAALRRRRFHGVRVYRSDEDSEAAQGTGSGAAM